MTQFVKHIRYRIFQAILLVWLSACGNSNFESFSEPALTNEEVAELDYKIDVIFGSVSQEPRLKFTHSFIMPRDSLLLKIPSVFLHESDLFHRLENLDVSKKGRLLDHHRSASLKVLQHPAGERVTISYLYRPYNPLDTLRKEGFSAPIIRADYFQFVGLMAFIYPISLVHSSTFPVTVSFDVPDNFSVYSSFDKGRSQKIMTDFSKLRDALFVGGDNMREYLVSVYEKPVFITFQGLGNEHSDAQYIHVVSRLLKTQRATWNDKNFPYFLVHFLLTGRHCVGGQKFSGTAHPNSFRAQFPAGCRLNADMKQLISHELMHMWIGKKIKMGRERGHIDGKWFTEGFTDYYGRLLAYRAGVITEHEYFMTLNRQLEKYSISDEKSVTVKELVKRMYRHIHTSAQLEQIPYQVGEFAAWTLNKKIKEASNFKYSLDSVVREMLQQAREEGGEKNFTVSEIEQIVDKYEPGALRNVYKKIANGRIILPPQLNDCRVLNIRHRARFHRLRRPSMYPIVFYKKNYSNSCERWLN